jgi:deferrochelatase/peroxidase EfeB
MAAGGLAAAAIAPAPEAAEAGQSKRIAGPRTEPFWGKHQGGILTPQQNHTYVAALDLITRKRDDVADLLRAWTPAAARMAAGRTAQPADGGFAPAVVSKAGDSAYEAPDPATSPADSGEAIGLHSARLTVTFGFGAGLFVKNGKDRYGLAARRPEALIALPKFVGDQLVEDHTGGDLSVQACADDPQVAFHAVRQLVRLADGVAQLRWAQTGFLPNAGTGGTPRNLMGFKDGTDNPPVSDPGAMAKHVWVGNEGPEWMRGGSYAVFRRVRIALEHWDRVTLAVQEQTIGRLKSSGAPLGRKKEFDALDLDAVDKDGNPVLPENSHVRLATAASNGGTKILRRGYSYNDGVNFTAERWPPWRQGLQYDAGLFFCCYQRDPRTGFVKIFDKMARFDMLNQFVTHVGGGLFACPPGAQEREFIGQRLFAPT